MDGILHYIWSMDLLPQTGLRTTDGKELCITAPGTVVVGEPYLFEDARIKIDGTPLCGNVKLHEGTRDGQLDLSNNNGNPTILHVSLNGVHTPSHGNTPLLRINCPSELIEELRAVLNQETRFQCSSTIATLPSTDREKILNTLLTERFKDKNEIIERILQQCDQRWDDALLKITIRSFGFGIQSDIFEKWASMLNTNALGKHSDNLIQIEAIFFGQAGLLNDESIPYYYRNDATQSAYYNELKREYGFLQNKFGLENLDHRMWGGSNSTPHLRIARLATLYYLKKLTISGITAAHTLTELYRLFSHSLNGYWQNHTCFGGTETCGNVSMKQKQVDVVIINSVIPMLHAYGKHRKDEKLCEKAMELLQQIDSEENSIIKRWREQGVTAGCAAHSQALLQLHRKYCTAGNCANCRFAIHYIKNLLTTETEK